MFRKIKNLISRLFYSKSVAHGIRLVQDNPDYLLNQIICQISADLKNKKFMFHIKVTCMDPYKTGYGSDNVSSLYQEGGFDSFDIAFGELTRQVIKASQEFDGGFYFIDTGNKCLYFDRESNRWIDYPSVTHKCSKCGNQVENQGTYALGVDDRILICKVCDGYMRQDTL